MSYTDEQGFRWDTRQIVRRIQSMFVRGTVARVDDGKKMQELRLDLEHGHQPTKVEHIHPYGISFKPHPDAEVVAVSMGGNRDHMMVIAVGDRRYRLKDLKDGEFAIHDDQGQKVHFTRDGVVVDTPKKVNIKSGEPTHIEAPTITLKGALVFQGDITHTGNMNTTGVHTDSNGLHA